MMDDNGNIFYEEQGQGPEQIAIPLYLGPHKKYAGGAKSGPTVEEPSLFGFPVFESLLQKMLPLIIIFLPFVVNMLVVCWANNKPY